MSLGPNGPMSSPILRARREWSVHRAAASGPGSPAAPAVVAPTPSSGHGEPMLSVTGLTAATALLVVSGQWPLPGPIVSGFVPPPLDWQSGHRGVDLRASAGEPVRSMAAGTVACVGRIAGIPIVTVRDPGPGRLRSTYEPVVGSVQVGQAVRPGDLLGAVASAGGHCGGRCLHVGLRDDATYLDPGLLVGRQPAVLKPTR